MRTLHGLMAQAAWEVLREALAEAASEPGGRPGAVISLPTFGAYGANVHPHLHGIVTEGVFTREGRFQPVFWPQAGALEEAFRRRFLEALERAGRLARYATRVVVATGKVRRLEGGRVRIETPVDPQTGSTWLELDELEFVHALCQQVPARGCTWCALWRLREPAA